MTRPSSQIVGPTSTRPRGFTLIELLVVIVIIGILAAIAIPSFRGLGESNVAAAMNQQLLSDLELARSKSQNEQTPVYIAFMPSLNARWGLALRNHLNVLTNAADRRLFTNLVNSQCAAYALIAARSPGDQPGAARPRYLTEWRTLPQGFLFPPAIFAAASDTDPVLDVPRGIAPLQMRLGSGIPPIPFPSEGSPFLSARLPGLTFSTRPLENWDWVVSVARGSVLVARGPDGRVLLDREADIQILPKGNYTNNLITLDTLTGRARLRKASVE